jgi:hypothetical protein
LLIYQHPSLDKNYHEIKSLGGVFKSFDFEIGLRFMSEFVFERFGAATVRSHSSPLKDFPVNVLGSDFHDPNISIEDINGEALYINSPKAKLLFMDPQIGPTELKNLCMGNPKILEKIKNLNPKLILFHQFKLGEKAFLELSDFSPR